MKHSLRFWGLALGGLALVAGEFFYLHAIAPLRREAAEASRTVAALQTRISDLGRAVEDVRELQAQASRERRELDAFMGTFPAGPALVWFPEQMKRQFGRSGSVEVVTRLNTARDEAELPDFQRTFWAVELPLENAATEIRDLCLAIAELDLVDPFLRVVKVAIRPDANHPPRSLAVISIAVLSPKVGTSR